MWLANFFSLSKDCLSTFSVVFSLPWTDTFVLMKSFSSLFSLVACVFIVFGNNPLPNPKPWRLRLCFLLTVLVLTHKCRSLCVNVCVLCEVRFLLWQVGIQMCPAPFAKESFLLPLKDLDILCWKSIDHRCMGLFLDF